MGYSGELERNQREERSRLFEQALREVSSALISTTDLNTMLRLVADKVAHVLQTRWVFLLLFDHQAQKVEKIVKGGDHKTPINTENYSWEEAMDGLSGWVVENGRTALSPKGQRDVRENSQVRFRRSINQCGAIIVAPLMVEKQVYGTLTAINREDERDFDETDADYMTVLANQASSALASRRSADQLARMNQQKELLLREAYHRMKNNLQLISGVIQLQMSRSSSETVKQNLRVVESRLRAITLIHASLYHSENHESVEGRTFLTQLIQGLKDSYRELIDQQGLTVAAELDEGYLPFNTALSLGLILNELMTNALKYAFPGEGEGRSLRISLERFREEAAGVWAVLGVEDNGPGLPEGGLDASGKTLGFEVVKGMTENLGGQWSVEGEGGTRWRVVWPEEGVKP